MFSSIDVLIFRRKENCMYTVSGIVTLVYSVIKE